MEILKKMSALQLLLIMAVVAFFSLNVYVLTHVSDEEASVLMFLMPD